MPRIIVTTDSSSDPQIPVLLDEEVQSVHLSTDHAAAQVLQRIAWAIRDAEVAERRERDPVRASLGRTSRATCESRIPLAI
jgi:hypothetical protein